MPNHSGLPRSDQITLSRLRAGRSTLTADVKYWFGNHVRTVNVPKNRKHGLTTKDRIVTAVADNSAAAKAKSC